MKCSYLLITRLLFLLILNACTSITPGGLLGKRSPHEQYAQSLISAGLKETALGRSWFSAAEHSLNTPLAVTIPYKESGYFPAEKAKAMAIRFEAKRGEKLSIVLQKKPNRSFTVYVDLWEVKNSNNKKLVAYADTGGKPFDYEIDDSGIYIIRLQPELLAAGEYALTITSGPSLAFPIKDGRIGSFWGADRDGGARRHEGIDIFAPRRTPALAAANGTISRVTTNELGGKVVFMRPKNKNYTLYYAHLDEQLVSTGQSVKSGDTIGLVGNTGNAISTSPHLHFGIYTMGGAIDPLVFVNPIIKPTPQIKASLTNLGKSMRVNASSIALREGLERNSKTIATLNAGTILEVSSATDNSYRVDLPDGMQGFISSTVVSAAANPLRRITLTIDTPLYDYPTNYAAKKSQLSEGSLVNVLGSFDNFLYINTEEASGWISKD